MAKQTTEKDVASIKFVISSSWSPIQFFFIYQIRLFLTNLKLQCNQRSAFDSSHHVKKTKEEGKKKTDVGSFSLQGWREGERALGTWGIRWTDIFLSPNTKINLVRWGGTVEPPMWMKLRRVWRHAERKSTTQRWIRLVMATGYS